MRVIIWKRVTYNNVVTAAKISENNSLETNGQNVELYRVISLTLHFICR